MATIQAPSMRDAVYQGPQGNLSIAGGDITLSAAAIGDVIEFIELPIGMRIHEVDIISGALGAGVTVMVKSGDSTLVGASSFATGAARTSLITMYTTAVSGEKVTAIIGGGVATGNLSVKVKYVATGY